MNHNLVPRKQLSFSSRLIYKDPTNRHTRTPSIGSPSLLVTTALVLVHKR